MPRPLQSFMVNLQQAKPMAAFVYTATPQSIPNATNTPITFATPLIDDPLGLNAWEPLWNAASPGQFTITVPGLYTVGANIRFTTTTVVQTFIRRSGTIIVLTNMTNAESQAVTTTVEANRGDVFDVQVAQTFGAAQNTMPIGLVPNFWIFRVA